MDKALLIIVQEYIISDFSSFCNAPFKTYAFPHRFRTRFKRHMFRLFRRNLMP